MLHSKDNFLYLAHKLCNVFKSFRIISTAVLYTIFGFCNTWNSEFFEEIQIRKSKLMQLNFTARTNMKKYNFNEFPSIQNNSDRIRLFFFNFNKLLFLASFCPSQRQFMPKTFTDLSNQFQSLDNELCNITNRKESSKAKGSYYNNIITDVVRWPLTSKWNLHLKLNIEIILNVIWSDSFASAKRESSKPRTNQQLQKQSNGLMTLLWIFNSHISSFA